MTAMEEPAIGHITSGLLPDTLARKTIDFVYAQLPVWRDDPTRPNEQSENALNLQLSKFLDLRARYDFPLVCFTHEEYQSGHASVDISASLTNGDIIGATLYNIYVPILVLEGKRLPAPSQDREKEYVTGGVKHKSGGIQRFKLGLHGANHNVAALVGYLQAGSASGWHDKINKWIMELGTGLVQDICPWNTSELLGDLQELASKGVANCESTHTRSGNVKSKTVVLRHLWVVM